jgi:hypothetical protein
VQLQLAALHTIKGTAAARAGRRARAAALAIAAAALTASCGGARFTPAEPEPGAPVVVMPDCLDTLPDRDSDGMSDACEERLARQFAPLLMVSATRCTSPTPLPRAEIAGGYLHGAQPVRGAIRLVYLPAYYRDCGWTGAKCILADCTPHAGDSELIALDVVPESGRGWRVQRVFLSAHCFGHIRSDCRWYEGEDLNAFEWLEVEGTRIPVVWVSDGRQANYPSRAACDRGHMRIDSCDADARAVRFPVTAARNIGSRAVPLTEPGRPAGCVSGAFVEPRDPLLVSTLAIECFWDVRAPFGGWQASGDGVTPYARYLELLGL